MKCLMQNSVNTPLKKIEFCSTNGCGKLQARTCKPRLRACARYLQDGAASRILDDVRQFGNVTLGVAPAIYKAAYGDDHQYDPANNRYVFKSADWLNQIIRATFQPCLSALDDRQMKFLVQLSKGKLDWAGFRQIDPDDIHSLDQLADYCATWLEGYVAGVTRSETVYHLIQRYGLNLFQLHAGIQAAFRRHTHVCVDPKQAHLTVERRAPAPSTQHVDNSTITNAPRPAASVGR